MRRLTRHVFTVLSALSLVLLVAGCTNSRFIVVDAKTGVPLAGVAVIKQMQEWPPPFSNTPAKRIGTTTPDGKYRMSGKDSLTFEMPGYRPAEVYFPSRYAWVISPADENAWTFTENHERHLGGRKPTKNFEWVNPRSMIVVRMFRAATTSAPAPGGARNADFGELSRAGPLPLPLRTGRGLQDDASDATARTACDGGYAHPGDWWPPTLVATFATRVRSLATRVANSATGVAGLATVVASVATMVGNIATTVARVATVVASFATHFRYTFASVAVTRFM